jgi:hypothetical protein
VASIQCESEAGTVFREKEITVTSLGSEDDIHDSVVREAEQTLGVEVDELELDNLLTESYVEAQELLRDNDACRGLFGTEESRRNGWDPAVVLGRLFANRGGVGSLGYGPTLV